MQRERQRSQCELDVADAEVDVVAITQQDGDAIDQVSCGPRKGQDEQRYDDGQPAHRPHDPSLCARKKSHEVALESRARRMQPPSRSACCRAAIGSAPHECSRSPRRRLEHVAARKDAHTRSCRKCVSVPAVDPSRRPDSAQSTYQRRPRGQAQPARDALLRPLASLDCLDGGRNPMKLAVGTAVIWTIPSLTFHAALTGATNKLCARSRHRAHVGPIRPLGVIQAQRYWTFVSETEVLHAAFRTRRTPNSAITTSTPSVTTDIRISAHSRQCGRRDRRA